jgi:hypothetical protein
MESGLRAMYWPVFLSGISVIQATVSKIPSSGCVPARLGHVVECALRSVHGGGDEVELQASVR